jgi:hypothetical protein
MILLLCTASPNMFLPELLRVAGASAKWCTLTPSSQQTDFVSPLLLVRMSIVAFTVFPMGAIWLGCPIQALGAGGFSLGLEVTCTGTSLQNRQMHAAYKTGKGHAIHT